MSEDQRTYCSACAKNYDDDGFDYRFDYPICHECVKQIQPEVDDLIKSQEESNGK